MTRQGLAVACTTKCLCVEAFRGTLPGQNSRLSRGTFRTPRQPRERVSENVLFDGHGDAQVAAGGRTETFARHDGDPFRFKQVIGELHCRSCRSTGYPA